MRTATLLSHFSALLLGLCARTSQFGRHRLAGGGLGLCPCFRDGLFPFGHGGRFALSQFGLALHGGLHLDPLDFDGDARLRVGLDERDLRGMDFRVDAGVDRCLALPRPAAGRGGTGCDHLRPVLRLELERHGIEAHVVDQRVHFVGEGVVDWGWCGGLTFLHRRGSDTEMVVKPVVWATGVPAPWSASGPGNSCVHGTFENRQQ